MLSGFGSKYIGNKYKGASSSVHPKRKIKSMIQPNKTP
jgi:hypothetical protein